MSEASFEKALPQLLKGLQGRGALKVFRPDSKAHPAPPGLVPTYPLARHLHVEMATLADGECSMIVEGHCHEMKPGESFLFLPYTAHAECFSSKNRPYTLLWSCFNGTNANFALSVYEPGARGRHSLEGRVIVRTDSVLKMHSLCSKIHESGEMPGTGSARLHALALAIACDAIDALEERGITSGPELIDHSVNMAIAFIAENYSRAISVRDIAKLLHLSPNYLNAVFKRRTGKPILRHIIELRMEAARKLLLETDLPVKAIAMKTGIEDSLYFCRLFKANNRVSPTEFRASAQSR